MVKKTGAAPVWMATVTGVLGSVPGVSVFRVLSSQRTGSWAVVNAENMGEPRKGLSWPHGGSVRCGCVGVLGELGRGWDAGLTTCIQI